MKNKQGTIVVLVLILFVAVVLVGAIYIFYSKLVAPQSAKQTDSVQTTETKDQESQVIENVDSNTDEVDSIQKDLDETNFATLEQDVLGVKTAADSL